MNGSIAHQIDERLDAVVLHRRRGNQPLIAEGTNKQTRIHELVGEKGQIGVFELPAKTDGPRRSVYLIVERKQLSRCDSHETGAIVRFYAKIVTMR
jgi:hypothetical protein